MKKTDGSSSVVIICKHIYSKEYPILKVIHDKPIDEVDSEWHVLCNSGLEESTKDAKIISVNELIKWESSLKELIQLPPGTILIRKNISSPWQHFQKE